MKRTMAAILATLAFLPLLTLNTGCSKEQMDAFRLTLMPGLNSGVKAIMEAVVDGAFAAATPDNNPTTGGQ